MRQDENTRSGSNLMDGFHGLHRDVGSFKDTNALSQYQLGQTMAQNYAPPEADDAPGNSGSIVNYEDIPNWLIRACGVLLFLGFMALGAAAHADFATWGLKHMGSALLGYSAGGVATLTLSYVGQRLLRFFLAYLLYLATAFMLVIGILALAAGAAYGLFLLLGKLVN